MNKRVSIVQRVLPHYRVEFFDQLHEALGAHGVDLQIIYSAEKSGTIPKSVAYAREWSKKAEIHYAGFGALEVVAQRCQALLKDSDLVVVEQANRLLLNYKLIVSRLFNDSYRLAFWGHGRNFQSKNPGSLLDRLKAVLTQRVDWWFTYTEGSMRVVEATGFSSERITTVYNTIETKEFREQIVETRARMTPEPSGETESVYGLYCGGMYRDKKLDFLLQSLQVVRDLVPNFKMIFIGAGPESNIVKKAADKYSWIDYVGSKTGSERVPHFAVSRALLIPGAVGLAIIDSFAAGIPLITVEGDAHGPELDYLKNGINGVIVDNDVGTYGQAIADVLLSKTLQARYRAGCENSSRELTLDNMVKNFVDGILRCLDT